MCGNSMHENREIPDVPSHGGEGRLVKACSRTIGMYATGKSDEPVVPVKRANKSICDCRGGVCGGKGFGRGEDAIERDIPDSEPAATGTLQSPMSPGLERLREAIVRGTMDAFASKRFYVYPRQEPYDLMCHVRICAGGRPQGRFLPRSTAAIASGSTRWQHLESPVRPAHGDTRA